ncbi:MAG: hypothetical protein GF375_04670 [Candidatus Omnitrophica bacterium]|nr:hypothetical protein [Candidatus Omnitrophota bacterium]MBD3269321.1 hypothetical protein [Candidatus Omnitrophota bacterium]
MMASKNKNILGLSCYYHDSAACIITNNTVTAAAEEERFNRIKKYPGFPLQAVNYCIRESGISFDDIDFVGFYEKPYLKFYRVILSHLRSYPFSLPNFLATIPEWLKERLDLPLTLESKINYRDKVFFIKHHLSHAASSFFPSGFEEATILTADAIGEWSSLTCGFGKDKNIEIEKEITWPDSLGLVYTAITTYLGFMAHTGEAKVMGLAGYGKPVYLDKLKKIIKINPDTSFKVDESYFGFNKGRRMFSGKFVKTFGKPRKKGDELKQKDFDMAASLQKLTEDIIINIASGLHEKRKDRNLCLGGGLFLNCVMNHRLLRETPFENIFIQPASGDSGGALGVASYINHSVLGNTRTYIMDNAFLGPQFSKKEIKLALKINNLNFKELDWEYLYELSAKKIAEGKIVGWFQERMEYGPRALGNRSIIANPCLKNIKEILNRTKKREQFRPFAPSVLEEKAKDYFIMDCSSPFMLLAPYVRAEKREVVPGITHVDGTSRVQTVNKAVSPKFWNLIRSFEKMTGVPLVLNTSFNLRGEPIACTPQDAIDCFKRSSMDILVMDKFMAVKEDRLDELKGY